MTKREMFEAIVNGNITEEVIAMCQKELNRGAEQRAAKSAEQAEVEELIKNDERFVSALAGRSIVKFIYVKGRIANIVVK